MLEELREQLGECQQRNCREGVEYCGWRREGRDGAGGGARSRALVNMGERGGGSWTDEEGCITAGAVFTTHHHAHGLSVGLRDEYVGVVSVNDSHSMSWLNACLM